MLRTNTGRFDNIYQKNAGICVFFLWTGGRGVGLRGCFRREFGHIDGAVALDLDEWFSWWKLGIVESVAIKRGEVWELLDGVVVY